MDAEQLSRWLVSSWMPAFAEVWETGERTGTVISPEYVQVSYRSLGQGYAEGGEAVRASADLRVEFPHVRLELVEAVPPNRAIGRITCFDDGGFELVALQAMRFRDGRLERLVIFDEGKDDEVRAALEDIDAHDADPSRPGRAG